MLPIEFMYLFETFVNLLLFSSFDDIFGIKKGNVEYLKKITALGI